VARTTPPTNPTPTSPAATRRRTSTTRGVLAVRDIGDRGYECRRPRSGHRRVGPRSPSHPCVMLRS
jgi:hypothetical protein